MTRRRTLLKDRFHTLTYITEEPNQEILLFYGGDDNNGIPTFYKDSSVDKIYDDETGEEIPVAHTYPETNTSGRVIKPGIYRTYVEAGEHKIKMRWKTNAISINYVFRNASLIKIPDDLFYDCLNVIVFTGVFENSKLRNISNDMFKNNQRTQRIERMFGNCPITHELTEDFFKPLINLEVVYYLFTYIYGTTNKQNITGTINDNWFKYNTKLKRLEYLFNNSKINGELTGNLFKNNTELTSLIGIFAGTAITGEVPEDIFSNNVNLESIISIFQDTSISGTIPENLFRNNTKLKTAQQVFSNCTNIIGSVPENLLSNNKQLTNVMSMFSGSGIDNFPDNLLYNNTELTKVTSLFYNCKNLTRDIPENLFSNNTKITTADSVFDSSNVTGQVPRNIFKNLPELTSVNLFFSSTQIEGSIPEDLLSENSKLVSANGLFSRCPNISGTIPENLFANNPELSTISAFLRGFFTQTNISGTIPENLFRNNPKLKNADFLFLDCLNLTGTIPENLFANNPLITSYNMAFSGCSNLTGEIPSNLFNNKNVTNLNAAFLRCGVTSIGKDLLKGISTIPSLSELFAVTNISSIPDGLFNDCININSAYGCFKQCSNLLTIPNDIFAKNKKITDFRYCFYLCGRLTGTVPVDEDGTPIYNRGGSGKPGYAVVSAANSKGCFNGCTGLSDYDQISDTWK